MNEFSQAAEIIKQATHLTAFCGAGISVESGIPAFRGENGLWSRYDPNCLDLDSYLINPHKSWYVIKEIFYDFFGKAKPNPAHFALAELENRGILKSVITQNIDNLHQEAGSRNVIEFHGNSHSFICTSCKRIFDLNELKLTSSPPHCQYCSGLLKPNFIFFGEAIPTQARERAIAETERTDAMLVIGTTGEVMPASMIPRIAKQNGAKIIEINPGYSDYKYGVSDVSISETAGTAMPRLLNEIFGK